MKNLIVSIAIVMLAGCAAQVTSSNPRQVSVYSEQIDAVEAHAKADAECAKYNRYARMTLKASYWERTYVFDCVD